MTGNHDSGSVMQTAEIVRGPSSIRTRKVLMVDDESIIIEGLAALLRDENFEVCTATSGEEAIAIIDAFDPDIVVLDVTLPGIDGVETGRRLRAQRPSLAVIFSSGHECSDDGADRRTRYLQKPFTLDALIDVILELEPRS